MTLCLMILGMVACEEETTQDNSKITYHADITLDGDLSLLWAKGTQWADPGYTAILRGKDVTDMVEIKTDLDVNKPGVYTINYIVTNEDGLSRSETRTVYVYDPTPSLIQSGVWTVSATSFRDATAAGGVLSEYGGSYNVVIIQVSPGKFYISDFLGGWYEQRAGYGSAYALKGHFLLDDFGMMSGAGDALVEGWGDSYSDLIGFVMMEDLNFMVTYADMFFDVTLYYNN